MPTIHKHLYWDIIELLNFNVLNLFISKPLQLPSIQTDMFYEMYPTRTLKMYIEKDGIFSLSQAWDKEKI